MDTSILSFLPANLSPPLVPSGLVENIWKSCQPHSAAALERSPHDTPPISITNFNISKFWKPKFPHKRGRKWCEFAICQLGQTLVYATYGFNYENTCSHIWPGQNSVSTPSFFRYGPASCGKVPRMLRPRHLAYMICQLATLTLNVFLPNVRWTLCRATQFNTVPRTFLLRFF